MAAIDYYIANSTGKLTELKAKIATSFNEAVEIIERELGADQIDIIFLNAPYRVIKTLGISGISLDSHTIEIRLDPGFKDIKKDDIVSTILHESHHCMRWRKVGYPKTLGDAIVAEGIATLYEEEFLGKAPLYAKGTIEQKHINEALLAWDDVEYDRNKWFFGDNNMPQWFGYTYGYKLGKAYSQESGKQAPKLVDVDTKLFYPR